MRQDEQNEWMSTAEARQYLGVSQATLYRLVDEGRVPAYRPSRSIRFKRTDLDTYLEAVRVRPGEIQHLRTDAVGREARRRHRNHEPKPDRA